MLNIYKASAGAGKTYTLTLEYIKLLFNDPKNYQKTLAVTFTNNACGEMKNRILKALYDLSFKENANYIAELQKENYSKNVIREKAKSLYKDILHNYSFFFVETIDSFTQKIIRNFAKDLGLPPKFTLELRQDEILETIIKNLLVNSIDNEELHQILVNFAFDDIEENKSTDIKTEIKKESNKFFNELYQEITNVNPESAINTKQLQNFFESLEEKINNYQNDISTKATLALDFIDKAGLTIENDFKGKSRSPLLVLRKLGNKDFGKPLKPTVCELDEVLSKEKTFEITNLYMPNFVAILQEIADRTNPQNDERKEIRTAEELLKHKQGIILSQYIQQELDTYCKNENTFFLAFANKFLKTIINDNDTPFVYEKIGQFIENIMIDEFQDTSKMQWDNFKPIVSNLLGLSKDALIIGDVKQSIYRFRNGDWKLLHTLDSDKELSRYVNQKSIDKNYRSLRNIVEFNNQFFKAYSKFVEEKFNNKYETNRDTIQKIYENCHQDVAKEDGGCVEVNIINANCEMNSNDAQIEVQEKVLEKVVYLLRNGRKAEDIVFLCYENDEISELVNFFNKKKNDEQYADIKDAFSIMSKEALALNKSLSIQFITTYLQRMTTTSNSDATFLNSFLDYAYSSLHTGKQRPDAEISHNMSLFETCEEIIEKFELALPTEVPFLTDFQNIVYNYSKNNNTSITHFLEHWNEIKDKTYLQQIQTSGCMSASTVHKSKGLEYPVVIMPQFSKKPRRTISALYKTNIEELPIVSLSGDLSDTTIKDEYINELFNNEIDNLNALYVACTRPREELYIFDKCTKNDKAALEIFETILTQINNDGTDNFIFTLGKPKPSQEKEDVKACNITMYPIATIEEGETTNAKLLPDKNARQFIERLDQSQNEREHGLLMHKILEHIITIDDVDKYVNQYCPPELFSVEEKAGLAQELKTKLNNPRIIHWFDKSWDSVLTEQPILQQNGEEKRPDRMLIKGKDVTIIDYKFTKEQPESHIKQVREYMNILAQMGYNPKGFVWYVELDDIKTV